jgi:hypothetical protein
MYQCEFIRGGRKELIHLSSADTTASYHSICISDRERSGMTKKQKRDRRKYIDKRIITKVNAYWSKMLTDRSKPDLRLNFLHILQTVLKKSKCESSEGNDKPIEETQNSNKVSNQRQKSNLVLSFCDGDDDNNDDEKSESSVPKCPVCWEAYAENDKICWSRNPQCNHAFHVECIKLWLLTHHRCPVCRSKYLVSNDDNDIESATSREETPPRAEADTIADILRAVYLINIVSNSDGWWFSSNSVGSVVDGVVEEEPIPDFAPSIPPPLPSSAAKRDIDIETGS